MYILNKNDKKPLYVQLYEQLKKDIIENYKIGDKLPSIRKMITSYNLSKTTVETAYGQLVAEGYIESYPNSGYRVEDMNEVKFRIDNIPVKIEDENKIDWIYNFHPVSLQSHLFPLKLWKKLFSKHINYEKKLQNILKNQGQ